nr:MAG TPA: hypothetical protein [Caudoviricetes sp.]
MSLFFFLFISTSLLLVSTYCQVSAVGYIVV